jgi:hypothetical protein
MNANVVRVSIAVIALLGLPVISGAGVCSSCTQPVFSGGTCVTNGVMGTKRIYAVTNGSCGLGISRCTETTASGLFGIITYGDVGCTGEVYDNRTAQSYTDC